MTFDDHVNVIMTHDVMSVLTLVNTLATNVKYCKIITRMVQVVSIRFLICFPSSVKSLGRCDESSFKVEKSNEHRR